ncbi:hypothetical protein LJB88_02065 [Erysipelotrichaceae bacterium OttesenSCG-928-M19]|nr:hypothetical protein [Erysipelotrichaceae bacterium OttesenSCG-928-M19]
MDIDKMTVDELKNISKDDLINLSEEELEKYLDKIYPTSKESKIIAKKYRLKLKFFKIHDINVVGKQENGIYYLYKDNQWVVDEDNIITDRLVGFDETEPEDSPYRIGNTDMLMRIDEITEDVAKELIDKLNK